MINIVEAIDDPSLFGPWFQGPSWATWRAILKAAFALPMSKRERELFRRVADREPPRKRVRELWIIAGRRAGKDSVASAIAAWFGAIPDYSGLLRPGEAASVMCLAVDRQQAKIVLRYTKAFFERIELLHGLVTREHAEGLDLSTGAELSVLASNYRSVRGRSVACAVLDECAFWRSDESVSPDTETYAALVPGLATLPGSMIVGISSPHRRGGLLYEKYRAHYGKPDDDVLVIRAPSRVLNPTLDQKIIDDAMARDPDVARAEWLAEWRDDIATFLSRDLIENAVDTGVPVRPPRPDVRYVGYVDAASGVGKDSFACAIAHAEGEEIIVDLVHEIRPGFNPTSATAEVCALLKTYRISTVRGDKYAAGFVIEAHAKFGINYLYCDNDTSTNYLGALPLFTSGRVRLVDNERLVAQFAGLERRTSPGGRDRVDHGVGDRHDDAAAAVAGALVLATQHEPEIPVIAPVLIGRPAPRYFPESSIYTAGGLEGAIADTRKSGFSRRLA